MNLDCDVIQADGGTRTAAITGASIALRDAITFMQKTGGLLNDPSRYLVAAVSVGIYQGQVILDLDYAEDSQAETDMNVIMTEQGGVLEVQATAEKTAFSKLQLQEMLSIAEKGINQLFKKQKEILAK